MSVALVLLAVLSLFTPFKVVFDGGQLRPFDLLVTMAAGVALVTGRVVPRHGVPVGLVLMLPFLVWHVLSALTLGVANGVREGVQMFLVGTLAWLIAVESHRLDYWRAGRAVLLGMIAIAAGAIAWHLANGYWTGWKRLIDPKAAFTFIPLALGLRLVFDNEEFKRRNWIAWWGVVAVVFCSGERKAVIVAMVLSAVLLAKGRLLRLACTSAAAVAMFIVLANAVDHPYLSRQMDSLLDPARDADVTSAMITGEVASGDTVSGLQRAYSAALARKLADDNPLFGIGTNGFRRMIREHVGAMPDLLRSDIHGEFLRVRTENGLVGLLCYVAVWVAALWRTCLVLAGAVRQGRLSVEQALMCPWIVFVPCLVYVSFEATGTHSFVPLAFVSLLPDVARYALPVPGGTRVARAHDRPRAGHGSRWMAREGLVHRTPALRA